MARAKPSFPFAALAVGLALLFWSAVCASADQANVFIYHRFDDSRFPSTNISDRDFQSHLEILRRQDFSVLTLGQIIDRIKRGESLPQRCAAITVDDAFRSFLTNGWPLLKRFGYPVTLFVSTDLVGGGDYLDWQELKALHDQGVELGNHSASHAYLLDQSKDGNWQARVGEDIARAQRAFASHLGLTPRLFAYPYGEFSPELVELVRQAGFDAAVGQQSGVLTPEQDLFRLPRFPMGGIYAKAGEFKEKLMMKHLPVEVVAPGTTLVESENPPKLVFTLADGPYDRRALRCYIPGQTECRVTAVAGEDGRFEVMASGPLAGRRSKYTITAPGRSGGDWYWFSQLWVLPRR